MSAAAGSPPGDPRDDNLIPFPSRAGPQMPETGTRLAPTAEVLDGELVGRPEFTRRRCQWSCQRGCVHGRARWARCGGRCATPGAMSASTPGVLRLMDWRCVVDPAWYRSGARCRVPVGEHAR